MVVIKFKTFDSFKNTVATVIPNPDRIRPDRFYTLNQNGSISRVAQIGMGGRIVVIYEASPNEIPFSDPWIMGDPANDVTPAVEILDIGENL